MAEKRMFAKTIIDSDAFMDMPLSTQALYFHLSMRADDDGFVNNPKKVQRMIGCGDDDMKLLLAKSFLIGFDSGVVVVTHWKVHNYIKTDRYKETTYLMEKAMLVTESNKVYALMEPEWNQTGSTLEPQIRLDKNRLDESSIDENRVEISSSSSDEEDLSTAVPVMPIVESYGVPVLQLDYAAFQRMTKQYMQQYWETTASDNDYRNVFELTRKRIILPNGEAVAVVDTDKQALLERALYISAEKGRQGMNWGFVQGILRRWDQLDLTTIDQIEEHEYHRKNKILTKGRC